MTRWLCQVHNRAGLEADPVCCRAALIAEGAVVSFGDERVAERVWGKVAPCPMSGCWLWIGATTKKGYGNMWNGEARRYEYAHRHVWNATVSAIPDSLQIDHLCRLRCCVNPAHLEPVTASINTLRGLAGEYLRRENLAKTHCPAGHPYSGSNLRLRTDGARRCRVCATRADRAYKERRRAAEGSR